MRHRCRLQINRMRRKEHGETPPKVNDGRKLPGLRTSFKPPTGIHNSDTGSRSKMTRIGPLLVCGARRDAYRRSLPSSRGSSVRTIICQRQRFLIRANGAGAGPTTCTPGPAFAANPSSQSATSPAATATPRSEMPLTTTFASAWCGGYGGSSRSASSYRANPSKSCFAAALSA